MTTPRPRFITTDFWDRPRLWRGLALLLVAPALLLHLGLLPLNFPTDEPRRALVALEMHLTGNYLTPTLNGEAYLNKPPLYNWIIAASYALLGTTPFATRLPVVLSLLAFAATVFWFVRRPLGGEVAWVAALATLTSGRLLFYDSFLGLIDVTFSWVVFVNFMVIYRLGQQQRYLALFVVSYLLASVGFLMKGLPALVFQALTLLVYFGHRGQWRRLFCWKHAVGVLTLLMVLGSYYAAYFAVNELPPARLARRLWTESAKRTVVQHGIYKTLLHLITFPLVQTGHFGPWTFLVVVLFRRGLMRTLRAHPFLSYVALVLLVNLAVYWTAPRVHPRYLFMFLPLWFTLLSWCYYRVATPRDPRRRGIEWTFGAFIAALAAGCVAFPFHPETRVLPAVVPGTVALVVALGLLLWAYVRLPARRLPILGVALLVARIGFDLFVLPPRVAYLQQFKDQALRVATRTQGKPLRLYGNTYLPDTLYAVDNATSFYIAAARGEVLRPEVLPRPRAGVYYLAAAAEVDGLPHQTHYAYRSEHGIDYQLVTFPHEAAAGPR